MTGYPSNTIVTPATRHLLVVDDDTELCQLLSEYLLPEGYDVESVHSGMEGVERALSGDHAAWGPLRFAAIASITLWLLTTLGGVVLPNIG